MDLRRPGARRSYEAAYTVREHCGGRGYPSDHLVAYRPDSRRRMLLARPPVPVATSEGRRGRRLHARLPQRLPLRVGDVQRRLCWQPATKGHGAGVHGGDIALKYLGVDGIRGLVDDGYDSPADGHQREGLIVPDPQPLPRPPQHLAGLGSQGAPQRPSRHRREAAAHPGEQRRAPLHDLAASCARAPLRDPLADAQHPPLLPLLARLRRGQRAPDLSLGGEGDGAGEARRTLQRVRGPCAPQDVFRPQWAVGLQAEQFRDGAYGRAWSLALRG
mmetsp:Transcript_31219/g.85647  ORF Transcript_31219/g.85647 Transcript_31219/m.85647 type:complete len:274 (+) Transcript_31219:1298-2119(+)